LTHAALSTQWEHHSGTEAFGRQQEFVMRRPQAKDPATQPYMVRQFRAAPLAVLSLAVLLTACASSTDQTKLLNPDPPDKMYALADLALQKGNWNEAARRFEDLDRDHPYAPEARRAIVMASFAYYKASKFPEAIASAQRYTTMHPGTKEAALAHHIIASAHFDDIKEPRRDQTATRKALNELKTLRTRYPDSPYSRQAENRIRIAEDVLAASEMEVGRFYQKNNQLTGAINRFKVVVTEYQTTQHVEEALYRLVETNMALGIQPEAQAAAAVLGHNFPNSSWYERSYGLLKNNGIAPQSGGWLAQAWRSIIPASQQPKQPEPTPQRVPEGLPTPEQLPAPRQSTSGVPVASPKGRQPMGLGLVDTTR
jgi:outer membrane protein assembly factor BamD